MIKLIIYLSFAAIIALTPAVSAGNGLSADFSGEGIVNFRDFAVLANAWLCTLAEPCWNPVCDISDPPDDIIDKFDLAEFTGYWLQLGWPYGPTTRVSVSSAGQEGNNGSGWPVISADGRYVAFTSYASNLVEDDTNGYSDIFVHDCLTGQTSRVSVSSAGQQGNGNSGGDNGLSISANGRYVAFASEADNLVEYDTNGSCDVFVHDRQTGETTRVSVSSTGEQADDDSRSPAISADGRYVAFKSTAGNFGWWDTRGYWDVFVHDRQTGETELVSVEIFGLYTGNSHSGSPSISADGRYVAFESGATNLVQDDTNVKPDIFVRDRQTGETELVSVSSTGQQGNDRSSYDSSISADGRYVAFESMATNLVEGDTNGCQDIFVHDRQTAQTTRVSVSSIGEQANRESEYPGISADGRYVAFSSSASNLVEGYMYGGAFVHDRQTSQTSRVNVSSTGQIGIGGSGGPSISSDGRYVAFASHADNLVEGDTNEACDVFVHDCFGY